MSKGEHCTEGPKYVRQHYIYLQKYMVLLKKCVQEKTLSILTAELYKYILELGIKKKLCTTAVTCSCITKFMLYFM